MTLFKHYYSYKMFDQVEEAGYILFDILAFFVFAF